MAAPRASTTIPPLISFLAGLALVGYVVESHFRPTIPTAPVRQALPVPPATSGRRQPSAEEIERVRSGRDLWHTLHSLRFADVTPEFAAALDALDASGPVSDVRVGRLIACHQARRPTKPLSIAIDALPAEEPWFYGFGSEAQCLIEVIAERAASDPERALPVLVRAYREAGNPDVLAALGKLDPAELPESVREDLRLPAARSRGIAVAIALGAAAKWPDDVRAALDRDPTASGSAVRALASRDDRASHAILARHVARHPKDQELAVVARAAMANHRPMAEGLIDVARDAAESAEVRAHAAWLVSVEADQPQAIRLAAIEAADPWLRSRLDEAVATVERRFAITPSREEAARRRRRAPA